jgi:hypothetical protein
MAVVTMATFVLAGCTTQQPGQASAATGTTTTKASPPYQAPTNNVASIKLPPRPKDIPVDGVDPCSLLTAQQQHDFGLGRPFKGLPNELMHNSPTCNFAFHDINLSGDEYSIEVDTRDGIQSWLNPYLIDTFTAVTIDGFPALDVVVQGNSPLSCATEVSVANGQMIGVDYGSYNHESASAMCVKAEKFATAVIATLQTLR